MIGVIANSSEQHVVGEFFELFKTPWEFYRSDRRYEVLLCACDSNFDHGSAKLILIYAGQNVGYDAIEKIEATSRRSKSMLSYKGVRIPTYGDSIAFREEGTRLLVHEESQDAALRQRQSRRGMVVRIGYDLFREIDTLLTVGQPTAFGSIPTLDLHIALLRNMIIENGIALIEVPPVPDGYQTIACLTHDVDHPSIRRHRWDHTTFGFLHRAVFGALVNFFKGRIPVRDLLTNWVAVLKLPFVSVGLAEDFWSSFADRYLQIEKGLPSTYYVIPFKGRSGKNSDGRALRFRAACYGARDIAETIRKIVAGGCEVGLHGIDAWLDSASAHEELQEIRRLTGVSEVGVRTHWLYYDRQTPAVLEHAEAAYDSTVGYNETVGYRAGTTQIYKPLQAEQLFEVPIHVMDTALFYPDYLGLSSQQATTLLGPMVDHAVQFGGCLTINWHDRSLAPERLWYACYRDLRQELKSRGAWFATAGQAVAWFRKRRSVAFETDGIEPGQVHARVAADADDSLPGLRLRVYRPGNSCAAGTDSSEGYVDIAFDRSVDTRVLCGVRG